MKLINPKYRTLKPTIEYLADEVVLTQAWKKTHNYIRAFNWYADTLELDVSALNIEDNVSEWKRQIIRNKLKPLEMVPAAKSETWVIDQDGWHPKSIDKREESPPIRPLAHMSIRDQTWASAAMLCLADAVESEQGNCSDKNQSFAQARSNKVYSYGNRLVCDWKSKDQAWFRWGNSDTYRKFFTDYQNFLKRPMELGRSVLNQASSSEEVYVVNLDLSKFYNTICRDLLIVRLKRISKKFGNPECTKFWEAFNRISDWKWEKHDLKLAADLKLGNVEQGLPQGLVSAGFFANAFLIEFDEKVGELIGRKLSPQSSIFVHDYCRYVDDLRLVISAKNLSVRSIRRALNRNINNLLKKHGGADLKLNNDKTKVTLFSDLDDSGSMSNRIEMAQGELSGPADRDVLDSVTGLLESFLDIEDIDLPPLKSSHNDSALLQIANYDHDIRPDTLKRFAANRLESIVRNKRRISNADSGEELLAKKLITAWMKDPSLALVLRKAMEIHPEADLFEPVVEAIFSRSSYANSAKINDTITAQMMDYLLADIFRCGLDFIMTFQKSIYPSSIKPNSVIDLIANYALAVIASANKSSKFVERQALMLLAATNKPVIKEKPNSTLQNELHIILAGAQSKFKYEHCALYEISAQMTGKFDIYAASLIKSMCDFDDVNKAKALDVFAKRGGLFWNAIWKQLKKRKNLQALTKKFDWAAPQSSAQPRAKKQLLSKVIHSDSNGFEFEHALIKLALSLLQATQQKSFGNTPILGATPAEIEIKLDAVTRWSELWRPSVKIAESKRKGTVSFKDPRYEFPEWIEKNSESKKVIYWIGIILRASVIGSADFTTNRWKQGDIVAYKGVKTSWFKRRMGMMHSPETLTGEYSKVTDWFSDLLIRCLQWPGFESTFVSDLDVRSIECLETFEFCLKKRLSYLNSLICNSSSLPALPTRVARPSKRNYLRVATVQQLLPMSSDFSVSDPELNNPVYRTKHREHLSSVCKLALKTLESKAQAQGEKTKPFADLIVFAEVAVHIDDQDLIKRLADTTGAIIFAGLVFTNHEGKLVNVARWFIPDYRESGRQWVIRDQGKENMTQDELALGIIGYRPCQHILELHGYDEGPFRISGAICYDATDIKLAADLRNTTDLFVVVAHNQDVNTFDNMAAALQYHMYQHIVISNIGEFGGSTIQAPYKERYDRLISHAHGSKQISISTADIDLAAFTRKIKKYRAVKTKPAGVNR